ncbi:uncharacterized protein LOC119169745 [Rhipicephalus microplus]|uniref:uncharacterized protein LOC119169745 n=1 Tax=Rhipicephalus microplus TaxID=6941 RepID=UPI003F6B7ADB
MTGSTCDSATTAGHSSNSDGSLDTFYSGVFFHICLFSFSVQRPPSTIVNASIAYIAGFVAKAVEERRTCTFCPYLHQSDGSSPVLMGLISLKSRSGLTFPKPEFVMVLVTIKKAVDIALPHIKKSNVRQHLAELILPHLEQCPLFVCPARDEHGASKLSVVFDKFIKPLLSNVGAVVTDRAAYRKKLPWKPLYRKVLRV